MSEKTKKKLLRFATFADHGPASLVQEINDLEDKVDLIEERMPTLQEDGKTLAIPGPKGEDGLNGRNGLNGKDGKDGQDGEDGTNGKDGRDGKDGVSPSIAEIVKKVSTTITPLIPTKEQIRKETIKDFPKLQPLEEEIKKLREDLEFEKKKAQGRRSGGGGRASHFMIPFPLTPDGVTKIFAVPKSINGYLLSSDNLPNVLMENNGYTINATRTQITLQTVDAPTYGSQLLYIYSTVFNTV